MDVIKKNRKEVSQTLLSMIKPIGKEKGCLSYDIFCEMEDENVYSLIEKWESRRDLNRHIASKNFSVLLGLESLLNEPSEIQIHTVSRTEGIEAVNVVRGKSP